MDTSSPEFSKSVVGSLQNKFGHLYDSNAEFYKMIAREIEKGLKDDANMKIEDLIGNIFTDINKKEQDVLLGLKTLTEGLATIQQVEIFAKFSKSEWRFLKPPLAIS